MSHVGVAIVAMENPEVLHILGVCVCSFRYAACNTHASCCQVWPILLYSIFPHRLINGTFFEKKFLNVKCLF